METVDFLVANAMAQEALLVALIRTHPDGKALSEAIAKVATGQSAIAFQGQQTPGMQAQYDAKIAQFREVAEKAR